MDQLLEALCWRLVVKHTSSFAGKPRRQVADLVERPWDSTPLQEAVRFKEPIGGAVVRWRSEGFGFVKVDGADVFTHVSVVRGPLEGLVGCREVDVAKSTANEMKYRAIELFREQDYEEILAKTRAEEAAEAAVRAAGEGQAASRGYAGRRGEGRFGSVASSVESSTRPVDNEDGRHGRADLSCQ